MSSPSNPTSRNGGTQRAAAEHILVLHCLREDSLLGQEGFSVRASSTGDASLQQWALAVDHYELPFDLRSGTLLSTQAPRRLALMPAPGGRTGLVHSSYLKEDTRGRPHSFMSHMLIYPRLDTATAAEAWGADDWPTEEYPRGASKTLPSFEGAPLGELVGQEALQRFLARDGSASPDQSLARVTYPSRLEPDPEARRRWLRAAIIAFLKSLEPGATRNRVCVLAEPGTVALLVYAIGRLLPPQLAGSFPFSTYEPPHTSLRENKTYRVLGSYSRGGLDSSEVESLRRRGYVLDTFRPVPAAELATAGVWPLEPLLDAVASGDWDTVDGTREMWAADPQVAPGVTPAALGVALRLRPLAASLADGTISPEGLAELKSSPTGEAMLRRPDLRARAWGVLRPIWTRPGVAETFTALLSERVDELLEATRRKAEVGPPKTWRDDWSALKALLPPPRRAEALTLLLQSAGAANAAAPVGVEERLGVLGEWSETAGRTARFPDGLRWLLSSGDALTLRALLAGPPKLSPRHAGLALCLALSGANGGWQADPSAILESTDEQFAGFLAELDTFADRKAALKRMAPSDQAPATQLASRLIKLPARDVPSTAVETVLEAARANDPSWFPFWLDGKNLVTLLERLGPASKFAPKIWAGLMIRFESGGFDAPERSAELSRLMEARKAFPATLATEDRVKLDAWATLNQLVNNPSGDTSTPEALMGCCEAAGTTREDLADRVFRRQVAPATEAREGKAQAKAFGLTLLRLYGTPDNALPVALKTADGIAGDGRRAQIKGELFKTIVPDSERDRLYGRNSYALSEISYVPSVTKPVVVAAPKAKSRSNPQGEIKDRAIFAGIGAGMTATLLGLFWFLGVFESAPAKVAVPVRSVTDRAVKAAPDVADPPASQRLLEENASQKERITALEKQVAELQAGLPKTQGQGPATSEPKTKESPTPASVAGGSPAPEEKNLIRTVTPATVAQPGEQKAADSGATGLELNKAPLFFDAPADKDYSLGTPEKNCSDFAFVYATDKKSTRSFLVTLRRANANSGQFTFYDFNIDEKGVFSWEQQLPRKNDQIQYPADAVVSDFSQQTFAYRTSQITSNRLILRLKDKPVYWPSGQERPDRRSILPNDDSDRALFCDKMINQGPFAIDVDSGGNSMHVFIVEPDKSRQRLFVASKTDRTQPLLTLDDSTEAEMVKARCMTVKAVGFIPGKQKLLVGFEDSPSLWVLEVNPTVAATHSKQYELLPHGKPVLGWDFDSEGKTMISLDASDTLSFWNTNTNTDTRVPVIKAIIKKTIIERTTCLALDRMKRANERMLATGDSKGNVTVWAYTVDGKDSSKISLNLKKTLKHIGPIRKLGFSADGRVLAALAGNATTPGMIRLWPCAGLLPGP